MPFVRKKDRRELWKWMNETGRPTAEYPTYVSESTWAEFLAYKLAQQEKPSEEGE